MNDALANRAAELPTRAGVYLFKDRRGTVIYVGKAVNLRARVRQYLAGADGRAMVPYLVRQAADVEVVVTDTEKEALLLENHLIKRHRPRYNVKLRDDANFLHVRIDPRRRWPRVELVRRIADDGARYFGPYASASKARSALAFLQRAFPLRTCTDQVLASRDRPCLLHQMHRCVAPCVRDEGALRAEYAELVDGAMDFLGGRTQRAVQRIEGRMHRAADAEAFEEAARLRDLARAIHGMVERQKVVDTRMGDRDVWGLHRVGAEGAVAVVPVREGVMGEPQVHALHAAIDEDPELLSSLLNATYPPGAEIPPEILLPVLPHDAEALADVLSERRGARVQLKTPSRGDKARLVTLAADNARVRYETEHSEAQRHADAMAALADLLHLPAPPHRMECFDNSNLLGESPVAAMSVFLDGRPARAAYRRYRVKTVVGADDYASMREILTRRLRRGIAEDELPDLLVVDGGRGQLGVAVGVLHDLGLSLPVIGIVKPRTEHARGETDATDRLLLPHHKEPLRLPAGHPALRLIQHLRDEVHAHALRYHRKVRGEAQLASVLEGIAGVGPARRRALLTALGSAQAVADASPDALAAVPGVGPALAQAIHDALNPS